jgi:hypothetical protein
MKIRFFDDTYIRLAPNTLNNQPIGTILRGAEIEVLPNIVQGEKVENNSQWYQDQNGWYYWSGTSVLVVNQPIQPPESMGGVVITTPVAPPEPTKPPESPMTPESPKPSAFSVPPIIPPLTNTGQATDASAIPAGETRLVPSLEILLKQEKQQPSIQIQIRPVPKPAPTTPTRTVEIPPTEPVNTEPVNTEPASPPVLVETPATVPTTEIPVITTETPTTVPNPDLPVNQPMDTTIPANETNQEIPIETVDNAIPKHNWPLEDYKIMADWWQARGLTGKGISIAILGTGVASNHPDLSNIIGRYNAANRSNVVDDMDGLGTQAALIAAGVGTQIYGVAPGANLLIGKIGDVNGLLGADALISGLKWAIDSSARIIVMLPVMESLELTQKNALEQLINKAISKNILLIAPIGDTEYNGVITRFPANLNGVFAVGGHDRYGERCRFSARSSDLDILAPGHELLRFVEDEAYFANLNASKLAATFTAGFLALVLEYLKMQQKSLSTGELFELLRQTAIPNRSNSADANTEYGFGLLNPQEILLRLSALA